MSPYLHPRAQALLRILFGEIHWRAPPWLGWIRNNLRRFLITTGLILLALLGALAGWRWYQSLPKPLQTTFSIEAPAVTCYLCNPPGKPNPLVLRFSQSAAPLKLTGKDLDPASESVRLSPAVKGLWHWDDDRTLRFQPAEDWPVGRTLSVKFARHGFVPAHVRLPEYGFEFPTPAFVARITDTQFHQDPVVAGDKSVVVTVTFSHPVDPALLEKRIRLQMFERVTDHGEEDRGATAFTVVYDKLRMNAYIHSALLAVQNKPG